MLILDIKVGFLGTPWDENFQKTWFPVNTHQMTQVTQPDSSQRPQKVEHSIFGPVIFSMEKGEFRQKCFKKCPNSLTPKKSTFFFNEEKSTLAVEKSKKEKNPARLFILV